MMAMSIQAVATLPPPKENLPSVTPERLTPAQAAPQVDAGSLFTNQSLALTVIILFFALLALLLLYLMVRHERCREFQLRIFTITILVFGSLLVTAAGFGQETLAPVIGFFGTIAGYILGRGELFNDRHNPERRDERG